MDALGSFVWFNNLGITGTTPTPATTGSTTPATPTPTPKKVDWNNVNNVVNTLLAQGQNVANIIATLKGQGVNIEGGSAAELRANAEAAAKAQRNEELLTIALWVGGGITLMVILAIILKSK
jgi:hypothetical protein